MILDHRTNLYTYATYIQGNYGRARLDPSLPRIASDIYGEPFSSCMQDSYANASHHLPPPYTHYENVRRKGMHVDMYLSVVRSKQQQQ